MVLITFPLLSSTIRQPASEVVGSPAIVGRLPTTTSPLRSGSYSDDGSGSATGTSDTAGVWTISPRLQYPVHLAGSGKAVVDGEYLARSSNIATQ